MHDVISRQAAIDAIVAWAKDTNEMPDGDDCIMIIGDLPSAQPEPFEITDEQAILHLQSTGWMQRHDKEMYESGLREQLADDSGSYDSLIPCEDTISRQAVYDALMAEPLKWDDSSVWESARCYQWMMDMDAIKALPSAQPEIVRCKDCKYGEQDEVGRWFCRSLGCQIGSEDGSGFCADAERRTDG